MNVSLYLAISLDGFIARENNDTSFTYPRSFDNFKRMASNTGNMVIGRRTFEFGVEAEHFPLKDVETVVVSSRESSALPKTGFKNVTFADSPSKALEILSKKGFSSVLVGGGSRLADSFLDSGLIDDIYFDIMPIILRNGIKPFENYQKQKNIKGKDYLQEIELTLIDIQKFSDNEFRVHYKVGSD